MRLREARERANLTQAELADRSGVPAAAISHFEGAKRKPSFANLRKLADALGVTIDFLLGRAAKEEAAGAEAQQLFRAYSGLPSNDREVIAKVIEALRSRQKDS